MLRQIIVLDFRLAYVNGWISILSEGIPAVINLLPWPGLSPSTTQERLTCVFTFLILFCFFHQVFFFLLNAFQNTDHTIEDEAFICYVLSCTILFFSLGLLWVLCLKQNSAFSIAHFAVEGGIKRFFVTTNLLL